MRKTALALLFFTLAVGAPEKLTRARLAKIVEQIRKADYEDDRAALKRLYDELAPSANDGEVASRVRYWRGFALWRRAFNGFNDNAPRDEIDADMVQALAEFDASLARDPTFVDAKIGAISCLSNLMFLHRAEPAHAKELRVRAQGLSDEALAAAPENPRLLWVVGANRFWAPRDRGGSQDKAIETYQMGLAAARRLKPSADPLEPSWGEPELLMNLAWTKLNATNRDVAAAEKYAREALALVPSWHYLRDILLPQIAAAKD